MEYAAGFFLSWTVPGPLAAHAAHFTARFRTAFVCALLAGESPLDPRVCAAAAAVCAGADGALALDATFAASERRVEVRRREERAAATTLGDSESQGGESSASLLAHTGSGRSALAGARMDAAVCESLVDSTVDLRKRAMRAMRSVTDAGIDALRAAEGAAVDAGVRVREACAENASDVGPATSTSFDNFAPSALKPGDAETVALGTVTVSGVGYAVKCKGECLAGSTCTFGVERITAAVTPAVVMVAWVVDAQGVKVSDTAAGVGHFTVTVREGLTPAGFVLRTASDEPEPLALVAGAPPLHGGILAH